MNMSFLLALLFASVVDGARLGVDTSEDSGVGAEALRNWDEYMSKTRKFYFSNGRPGWQSGCQPKKYWNEGRYRGTVMLFHGYTACTQQYDVLAPKLAAQGYQVFVPLLPGHGFKAKYVQTENGTVLEDWIADLPTDKTEYEKFGDEMHGLMLKTKGERGVFGLSHGGNMANYVGNKGSIHRRLIAAAFISAGEIPDVALDIVPNLPTEIKDKRRSWGEHCEYENSLGRAGFCQFTIANTAAAQAFGEDAFNAIDKDGLADGSIQILFVDGDGAVHNDAIFDLARKMGFDQSSPNVCGLGPEVDHSFMSIQDMPGLNVWWLDEVTQKVTDYLAKGKLFEQSMETYTEQKWPRCAFKCTPESCHKTA